MASALSPRIGPVLRGRVVTPDWVIPDGVVIVRGDRLAWVGPAAAAGARGFGGAVVGVPPSSRYILPGLVDLHCHGGGGVGFAEGEAADAAVDEHRRHGTTTLVASLLNSSPETLRTRTRTLVEACVAGDLAGIHVEGPFLAPTRRRAQDSDAIREPEPDPDLVDDLLALGSGYLTAMTLAPEVPGTMGPDGVAARLVEGAALPSFGHTDAGSALARRAVAEAAALLARTPGRRSDRVMVTHLFNGMRPLDHRDAGAVSAFLAAAAQEEAVVELLADGVHLDPNLVCDVVEIVGCENAVLITAATAAAGMPDGDYRLDGVDVTVAQGVARRRGGATLAGSTAHLLDVVRVTVGGGVPLVDAVSMASVVPARVLGDDDIGSLVSGKRADLLVTDADLRPVRVLRAGCDVRV